MAAIAFIFGSLAGLLAGLYGAFFLGLGFWAAFAVYLGLSIALPLLALIPAMIPGGPGSGSQLLAADPVPSMA